MDIEFAATSQVSSDELLEISSDHPRQSRWRGKAALVVIGAAAIGAIALSYHGATQGLQGLNPSAAIGESEAKRGSPQCLAWNMSMMIYSELAWWPHLEVAYGGRFPEIDPSYKVEKKYKHSTVKGDQDDVSLWKKGADCWIVFQGTDGSTETGDADAYVFTPIEKWGLHGLNKGMVKELEPLVKQMDFQWMRRTCPGKFTVTGHSMGGGLAQLFALLLSQTADPLEAGLTVDALYTFGGIPPSTEIAENQKSTDKCFDGAQYWSAMHRTAAEKQKTNNPADLGVDVVAMFKPHNPIRSKKLFLCEHSEPEAFTCGTSLPESTMPLREHVATQEGKSFDDYGPLHGIYGRILGCFA